MGKNEESAMDKIVSELAEFICDVICKHPGTVEGDSYITQQDLEDICIECNISQHIQNVLNQYNKLNVFDKTQTAAVMKKYSAITLCSECEYRAKDVNDYFWCRCANGIIGHSLGEKDGCSIGKRK